VECVKGAAQGTRQPRTAFGGRPVTSALVTWTLVAVNVLVFLIEVVRPSLLYTLEMIGTPVGTQAGVVNGEWYRLLTAGFTSPGTSLAGLGFLDVAFNVWVLVVVGPTLEQALGRVRFIAVYLLSALGGSALYYYLVPHGLAAGASSAVYGLFGAYFIVARKLRVDVRWIVTVIAINLAFSLFWSSIAWQYHVGGLIAGALTTAAFVYAPSRNRTAVQAGAALAILAVLIALVVFQNHALTS
jgi:membrane associated rhomboid family serine protease